MFAYDGDVTLISSQLILWTISLYPLIMIASSVAAWLAYRREKSSCAGKIFLIPLGYILLVILLTQIGLFD